MTMNKICTVSVFNLSFFFFPGFQCLVCSRGYFIQRSSDLGIFSQLRFPANNLMPCEKKKIPLVETPGKTPGMAGAALAAWPRTGGGLTGSATRSPAPARPWGQAAAVDAIGTRIER